MAMTGSSGSARVAGVSVCLSALYILRAGGFVLVLLGSVLDCVSLTAFLRDDQCIRRITLTDASRLHAGCQLLRVLCDEHPGLFPVGAY